MKNKDKGNLAPVAAEKKNQQECINGAAAINPQGQNTSSANIVDVTKRDKDDNDKNSFKENRRKNTMSVADWRKEGQKDKASQPDTEKEGSLNNKKSIEKDGGEQLSGDAAENKEAGDLG